MQSTRTADPDGNQHARQVIIGNQWAIQLAIKCNQWAIQLAIKCNQWAIRGNQVHSPSTPRVGTAA